jgi:transcriptional regulator with XRE-family HTH domain
MPNYMYMIKKLREKKGMTQKELANALNVTQTAITYWETGKREPNAEIIEKIANFFGVTPAYIMGWENTDEKKYYLNEETAKLAQEMFEDEDMRSLFHMKRDMPPERFQAHIDFMKNLYNQEKGKTDPPQD